MKPYIRGTTIFFREVKLSDAEFIVNLRTDAEKGRYLSPGSSSIKDQVAFISSYLESYTEFYFIICDWKFRSIGTIRIYDVQNDSFCWGSWLLSKASPRRAAIESALLIYDFGFYALHYKRSHFDVRKQNERVVEFHKRFGANIVGEDDLNYYFHYTSSVYEQIRKRFCRFLP